MSKFIAIIDVDQIQNYLYTTDLLKEITGSSSLLDRINRSEIPSLLPNSRGMIYSSGGVTKRLFESKPEAESFCKEGAAKYPERTSACTATWHIEEWKEGQEGFSEANRRAELELRRKKDAGGTVQLGQAPQQQISLCSIYTVPCSLCGQHPGSPFNGPIRRNKKRREFLCEACKKKHEEGIDRIEELEKSLKKRRPALNEEEAETALEIDYHLFRAYKKMLYDEGIISRKKKPYLWYPREFDDIATPISIREPDEDRPAEKGEKSFLCVISADGNSIGEHIENRVSGSPAELTNFANGLKSLMAKATIEGSKAALHEYLPLYSHRSGQVKTRLKALYFPMRVLMLGGDDLVIVTTAELSLPLADLIGKKFWELSSLNPIKNKVKGPLSLSFGVAIAKAHYPFGATLSIAEELLKEAKARGRELRCNTQWTSPAMMNFAVIRISAHETWKDIRRKALTYRSEGYMYERTVRPYVITGAGSPTEPNVEDLREGVKLLRGLPRNKVKAVAEFLEGAKGTSDLAFGRWLSQLQRQETTREMAEKFIGTVGDKSLWRVHPTFGATFITPVWDWLETLDFWPY